MLAPRDHQYFMKQALDQAYMALKRGEIPVGAVVVSNGQIIARAHNLTETLTDVTAHAEIQAITAAANFLGGKYLNNCQLYVTLEPCQMCAGALYWSQVSELIFGAYDTKRGYQTMGTQLHPKTKVIGGILEEEASQLMSEFFQSKRKK